MSDISIFEVIYQKDAWGAECKSGPGSTPAQTASIRRLIPYIIELWGIRSILDFGCGDCKWIQTCLPSAIEYIGYDESESCIADNRRHYPDKTFIGSGDPLPKCDLVICRDVLVHLPTREIMETIVRIKDTGSAYLLCTTVTDFHRRTNIEISRGDWRPLQMTSPPFGWPEAIILVPEFYATKKLGLWKLSALP